MAGGSESEDRGARGTGEETVRQTIVESLEAPRLKDVSTKDFSLFREKREEY